MSLDDVHDLGDAVVGIGTVHGRGRGSGVVVGFPAAVTASVGREGGITRPLISPDVKEALESIGLAE